MHIDFEVVLSVRDGAAEVVSVRKVLFQEVVDPDTGEPSSDPGAAASLKDQLVQELIERLQAYQATLG